VIIALFDIQAEGTGLETDELFITIGFPKGENGAVKSDGFPPIFCAKNDIPGGFKNRTHVGINIGAGKLSKQQRVWVSLPDNLRQ
jgi:hypothetical protein